MAFNIYQVDSLLWGVDVILELLFAAITMFTAYFAYKVYRFTSGKQAKFFGISFFFISLSYLTQSIFNFLIISKLNQDVTNAIKLQSIILFNTLGLYAHIIFMMIGLALLLYMTFKIQALRILLILLIISPLAVFMSKNILLAFFLLTAIYLFFISLCFLENYLHKRKRKTLITMFSFIFLLLGRIIFIFISNHAIFYPLGHILELIAYLLIMWDFYLFKKND